MLITEATKSILLATQLGNQKKDLRQRQRSRNDLRDATLFPSHEVFSSQMNRVRRMENREVLCGQPVGCPSVCRSSEDGGAVSLRPAPMFKALIYAPWLLRREKPRCSIPGLPPLMTCHRSSRLPKYLYVRFIRSSSNKPSLTNRRPALQ